MNRIIHSFSSIILIAMILFGCNDSKKQNQFQTELQALDLKRGEITLCGSSNEAFGSVSFSTACNEKTRQNFNTAAALLHSFEYPEAEKMFAKVIDEDPSCVMAYWGAAMCSFHPMWEPPRQADLEKGSKIIKLARSLIKDKSSPESQYIEAIATIYDDWDKLDHRTRVLKFEKACSTVAMNFQNDIEAQIFHALSLMAASDPKDKTFTRQKKAGEILNTVFTKHPDHPGAAHYIIHAYDYPELADMALPTARKYAALAPASAHAQHMPSHIFTRLGLWEEAVNSNLKSVSAAQCYAQSMNIDGHWDEELHGLDYVVYAYLQQADDEHAKEKIEYLKTIEKVFPITSKVAYAFAAMPSRYVLERKDWEAASQLKFTPSDFPWEKFPWESANLYFTRILGAVNANKHSSAKNDYEALQMLHTKLTQKKDDYKANLVLIQLKISDAWIKLADGKKSEAIALMIEAAEMEEATSKHPVTPGEVIPARELLGDMYLSINETAKALEAYEVNLKTHPNRFNGLCGAIVAAKKTGDVKKTKTYFNKLSEVANLKKGSRPQLQEINSLAMR